MSTTVRPGSLSHTLTLSTGNREILRTRDMLHLALVLVTPVQFWSTCSRVCTSDGKLQFCVCETSPLVLRTPGLLSRHAVVLL